VNVTVEVPAVNVAPGAVLSQLPSTVHAPDVSVSNPEVPPPTVTVDTVTAEAFAARAPALPTVTPPPVKPRLLVASVVAPAPPCTVRVPDQTRARAAIVNVAVEAPLLKLTLLNSAALAGRAAKVIVWADDEVKVTVAVPIDQFPDVELLVQEPLTVQSSEPNEMYEAAAEMFTFPVILTAPEVEVSAPPDIVRPALAVSAFAPFASIPAERVSIPATVS